MKVLYLASRTPTVESLALEVEITGIQRRLLADAADPIQFIFLPDIELEDVPLEITRLKPDVLHISVHGEVGGLWFASGERMVPLSAEQLAAFLPRDHLPKLVFLNACESHRIAEVLSGIGVVAIGTEAPITNRAAVAAATLLYDRLLHGYTLRDTFEAVAALVAAHEEGRTQLVLKGARVLADQALVMLPHLVAKLGDEAPYFRPEEVRVKIGFAGCPETTTQICFFTDDPSFIEDENDLSEDLTEVVRTVPRGGEIWTETDWVVDGDFRVAACGITGSGVTFSASARLSDLLESYGSAVTAPEAYRAALPEVVAYLRQHSGAGLIDWQPVPARKKKKPIATKRAANRPKPTAKYHRPRPPKHSSGR